MLANILTNNFTFKKQLLYCVDLKILEIKFCDDKNFKMLNSFSFFCKRKEMLSTFSF